MGTKSICRSQKRSVTFPKAVFAVLITYPGRGEVSCLGPLGFVRPLLVQPQQAVGMADSCFILLAIQSSEEDPHSARQEQDVAPRRPRWSWCVQCGGLPWSLSRRPHGSSRPPVVQSADLLGLYSAPAGRRGTGRPGSAQLTQHLAVCMCVRTEQVSPCC